MKPLKITASLSGPLVGPAPPHLDALLEWCMSRRLGIDYGLAHNTPGSRAAYKPGLIPIPVKRQDVGGHPIPLCSSPILSEVRRDGVEYYAKRLDLSDPGLIAQDARRVTVTNAGEFKGYRLPLRVRVADCVVWFAMGRGAEVRKLLKDVHALGKKTSQGFGRIEAWLVEQVADDWSWFAPTDHGPVLMRILPTSAELPEGCWGYRRCFGGPCPPYWLAEHRTEVYEPC